MGLMDCSVLLCRRRRSLRVFILT